MNQTFCQCLISPMRTIWLEYDMQGNLIALHDTNSQATPERLYSAIQLPALQIPNREIVYWRGRVKESTREIYHAEGR